MTNAERCLARDLVADMRELPPVWVNRKGRRGKEHIGLDDVWWPDARGIDPYAKLVRRKFQQMFRVRLTAAAVSTFNESVGDR